MILAAFDRRLLALSLFFTVAQAFTQEPFITTWESTAGGMEITIPTFGPDYDYDISWRLVGDPNEEGSAFNQSGNFSITFANSGIYEVAITGNFPRIFFNNGGDRLNILSVEQWGDIAWTSMYRAFYGCENLIINATDAPNLTNVNSCQQMFRNCMSMNGDINHWNTSNVQSMSSMFSGATSFNQNLSDWDVRNVQSMSYMFFGATSFNQNLSDWDVSNVLSMSSMFEGATSFNQNLIDWDVRNVEDMSYMFFGATSFNGDISNWETSNLQHMFRMFQDASNFNSDLSNWNTASVRDMRHVFKDAVSFNQDIGNWDVGMLTSLLEMFDGASSFNQNLNNWNVSNVDDMTSVFRGATSFNGDISNWQTENVRLVSEMFSGATSFNQDIGNWDVGNIQSMNRMFEGASSFNQSLGDWDISSVGAFISMLSGTGINTGNFDATLIGWSTLLGGETRIPTNIYWDSNLTYCAGEEARNLLDNTYNWVFVAGSKDCTQTITFSELADKVYGDAAFNLTATTNSNLPVSFSVPAENTVATVTDGLVNIMGAGTTQITASQSGDGSYDAAENVAVDLIVNPSPLNISVENATRNYGSENPSFLISYEGFVLAEAEGDLTSLPTAISEATQTSGVGNYPIIASGASSPNYAITYEEGTLTIEKETLTVTADDQSRSYGAANPDITLTYSGFVLDQDEGVLDTAPTTVTEANTDSPPGTYAITFTEGADDNYHFEYEPGLLTIAKAPLMVSADDHVIKEGDAIPELNVSYDGFVNNDNESVLAQAPTATTTAMISSPVGIYPITVSGGQDENYDFQYEDGILIIEKVLGLPESNIRVYPNPAQDFIQIESDEVTRVEIYDLGGKLQRRPKGNKIVDLTGLKPGVYLMTLSNDAGDLLGTYRLVRID